MTPIAQAVILAGGLGTRLKPFTLNHPKPMIPVNGKPFLVYLIELLKKNGIKEVIILTGYLSEKIENYFGDGTKFGIRIKYSYTPFLNDSGEENKSGIRLKNAVNMLDNYFLLLYCDNYWPLELKKIESYYKTHPSEVLVTVYSNKDNSTKNNILVNKGYIIKYDKERKDTNLNGVDIGFFIVNKKALNLLPKTNSVFETIVIPNLISQKKLSGFITDQKYYSIGDPNKAKITAKFLAPKKIVFLDRDGVINKKAPKAEYIKNWSEFEFLPGSLEAIKLLKSKGYKVFVISNQSGIARGMMTIKNLNLIHENMQKEVKKNGG